MAPGTGQRGRYLLRLAMPSSDIDACAVLTVYGLYHCRVGQ